MAKPVAVQPPLPNPTGNITNLNLATFDQDLVRALTSYLGGVALRLNTTITNDGTEPMKADLDMGGYSITNVNNITGTGTATFATGAFTDLTVTNLTVTGTADLPPITDLTLTSLETDTLVVNTSATVPTPAPSDDSTAAATTEWVNDAIAAVVVDTSEFVTVTPKVFTDSEQAQARANIGASGVMSEYVNKIINGDFDIWQRATSQTSSGYGSADRWINAHNGSSKTYSRQSFSVGQSDVPGNPKYYARTIVTSSAGASNYVLSTQYIEGVETLAGQDVTITFYAKADATRNIAVELVQRFGTGGSPSSNVSVNTQKISLTTSWQRFDINMSIPSISGKTLGSDNNDALSLIFWFDAGTDYDTRTDNLGQQSGTFDIAHVALVEGDRTLEADPFYKRHISVELGMCQRYYETGSFRTVLPIASSSVIASYYTWVHFSVTKRSIPNVSGTETVGTFDTSIITVDGAAIGRSNTVANRLSGGTFIAEAEIT